MKKCLLILCSVLVSGQAFGWGATGHRVIAEIAAGYISAEARLVVEEILGPETLAEASTWPDFMRADPAEFWQKTANPWHYVTVPSGRGRPGTGRCGERTGRLFANAALIRKRRCDEKALALRFIVISLPICTSRCTWATARTAAATISKSPGSASRPTCTGSGIRI